MTQYLVCRNPGDAKAREEEMTQGEYLYYSVLRKYSVEPWIKRQWLKESEAWERDVKWWKHIKLDFCKEMQMMESSVNILNGKAQDQRYYNLAIYYAQASVHGDCWWLMRDFKGAYDTVRVNEANLGQRAYERLQKAATTSDPALKRKALFAMGYRELYGILPYSESNGTLWRERRWDSEKSDYVDVINKNGKHLRRDRL